MSVSFNGGFKHGRFERLQQDLQSLGYECWIEGTSDKIICVKGCSSDLTKIIGGDVLIFWHDFLSLDGANLDPPGANGKSEWKLTYPNAMNGSWIAANRTIYIGPDSFSFNIYQYGWSVRFDNENGQKKFKIINSHGGYLYNSAKHVSQASQNDVDMVETIVDNIIKSHRLYEKYALNQSYGTL